MTSTKLIKRTGFQLIEAEALGASTTGTTCEWPNLPPAEVLGRIEEHLTTLTGKGRRTAVHSLRRAVITLIESETEAPAGDLIDETVIDEMGEEVPATVALANETKAKAGRKGKALPEPTYITSVDFSGLRWLVPGAEVPANASVVKASQVDPEVRDEARAWLAAYVPEEVKVEAPKVEAPAPAAALAGIEIGREKIVAATRDALARMPKGSKSNVAKDGSLVVADGEAEAVVAALTLHMREGVKADRGGFMYTEGKLRGVRASVIAAHPDGAKGLPQPKAKGTASAGKLARVEALNDQLAAARVAKAAAKTQPAAAKRAG